MTLPPADPTAHGAGAWRATISAGVAGLIVGGLTLSLAGVLPGSSNRLANSGAVWVVGVFVAGTRIRPAGWRAWLAGMAVLVGAVAGYYGSMAVFEHHRIDPASLSGPIGWSVVGLASGPVFATAGSWWRDERLIRRVSSLCLLGGVFVAEAGYLEVSHRPAGQVALMLAIGLLLPVVLGRSTADRLYGMAALIPVAAVGLGGYLFLSRVLDVAFTRGT